MRFIRNLKTAYGRRIKEEERATRDLERSIKAKLENPPLRLVAAILGAIVWSVGLTVALYFTLGITFSINGNIGARVPIWVVLFIMVVGCAWGIGTAIAWYKKKI